MSAVSLDDIRARDQAATEGPWHARQYLYGFGGKHMRIEGPMGLEDENIAEQVLPADAHFIAHARTDIPFLLDERDKLRAALDAVLALAEEWRYKNEFGWGAWLEGHGPDLEGHVLDDVSADLRKKIKEALA